jgi:hypothetical protein
MSYLASPLSPSLPVSGLGRSLIQSPTPDRAANPKSRSYKLGSTYTYTYTYAYTDP